ncbi:MAG: hypothetical protein Q9221_003314 [Calogaya cf. arnoldii]
MQGLTSSFQAEAEAIQLDQVKFIPRKGVGKSEYLAEFPLTRGKIPGLEGPNGLRLTETLAISTYLGSLHNRAQLLGDGTLEQKAQILSWMSWANEELLPTLALWFVIATPELPSLPVVTLLQTLDLSRPRS